MEMAIRAATKEDFGAICELLDEIEQLHIDHLPHIFRNSPDPAHDRKYILDIMADKNVLLLVVEAEGRVIGFVQANTEDSRPYPNFVPRRFVHVDTIVVKSGFKHSGIGRALMERVNSWAKDLGIAAVELNVYDFNQEAIAFYQSLGYKFQNHRMTKSLP